MDPARMQPAPSDTPVEQSPVCLIAMLAGAGLATVLTGGASFAIAPFLGAAAGNVFGNILTEATKAFTGFVRRKVTHDPARPSHNYDISLLAGKSIHAIVAVAISDYPKEREHAPTQAKAVLGNLAEVSAEQFAVLIESSRFAEQLRGEKLADFLGAPHGGLDERAASGSPWFALLVAALNRKFEQIKEWRPPPADEPAGAGLVFVASRLWERFPAQFNGELRADAAGSGRAWAAFQARLLRETLELVQNHYRSHREHRDQFADFTRRVDGALHRLTTWTETIESKGIPLDKETRATLESTRNLVGSTYETLGEVERHVGELRASLIDPLLEPIGPADRGNEQDRFKFRNRRLTAVGRAHELDELHTWLDDERPFSWALWTGPAGSGKSRLALELCLQRPEWRAGFFRIQKGRPYPDWSSWDPRSDVTGTLIVFDYVAERAEEIGEAILTLSERAYVATAGRPLPAGVKVRFLLLERGTGRLADGSDEPTDVVVPAGAGVAARQTVRIEPPWLTTLRNAARATSEPARSAHVSGVQDGRLERPLGGVDEPSARAIIREEAALHGLALALHGEEAALQVARRVDPMLRPLFVAMAAEAVREKGGTFELGSKGEFDALVDHIRDKEWRHAVKRLERNGVAAGDFDKWARLTCLATMCGGLQARQDEYTGAVSGPLVSALSESPAFGLPDTNAYGDGSSYYLIVSGAGPLHAPELEPDVLGETFVLDYLACHSMHANAMISRAWELGMREFVAKAAWDFPNRVEAVGLLAPRREADVAALVNGHVALALRDLERGDRAKVAARAPRLLAKNSEGVYVQPAAIRALGVFAWTHAPLSGAELDELLADARAFTPQERADAAVRERLANGLTNAIAHAGSDTARADGLLAALRGLAEGYPDDAAVREQLAGGLLNAFNNAEKNSARADGLLAELRGLAGNYPDDAAAREWLAKGLANAIADAVTDSARADRLLAELRGLAGGYPDDGAARKQLARGLNNAIADAGTDSARADKLLNELRELARDNPDDAAVREWLAKGLTNAIAHAGSDTARADGLLKELRELARDNPDDAAVREQLAKGLTNAMAHAGSDTARADGLLNELRELARDNPADAAVREQLAKGLTNAMAHSGSDTARADGLLKKLRELARNNPDDAAVREWLAKGLNNAIADAGTDTARADGLLKKLRELARNNPADAAVREWLAKGLNNAIAYAGSDTARADGLLAELRALAGKYPADAAVREQLAGGLFNAFNNAEKNSARADGLLAELLRLAPDHLQDGKVKLIAFRGCGGAFVAGLEHELVRVHAVQSAAGLVPGLPRDDEAKQWARKLLDLVLECLDHGVGPAQADLDAAGQALWRAYKAHFGAE